MTAGVSAGRIALVTGGASGIGRATAERLASDGATVVAADVDAEGARETAARIERAGGRASFVVADVGDEASVEAMVAEVVARHGRLDAALNNAGISDAQHSWIDFPTDRWQRMIAMNLGSVFLCMKHQLAVMSAQEPVDGLRGAIVNVSSGAGLVPAPGQPHYTAAKHGVIGLTRSAAQEFARAGIRVNTVCPGLTDTPMIRSQPPAFLEAMARMSPTGALGTPDDIARAAAWLLSPDARWVNGQSIAVDGGGIMH
jgi:NAD(P)-dependent dehydrogenase (short-subunit alcohol dehydrogenase family)